MGLPVQAPLVSQLWHILVTAKQFPTSFTRGRSTSCYRNDTPTDRRTIELEWRYATDPHLPPRAPPHFRPREDPKEHLWTYGFKDEAGRLFNGTGTLGQIEGHIAFANEQVRNKKAV